MRILALASTLAALCPAQQTWVVDPQGTGQFTDLALAIASAAPGDTLILRNGGSYPAVTLTKVLHFVGEAPRSTVAWVFIEIRTVGPDPATFSNLQIPYINIGRQLPVLVPVVFEDVGAEGVDSRSSTVTMSRCTITGGTNLFSTPAGLTITGGQVALSECVVSGHRLRPLNTGHGTCGTEPGTPGIAVNGGSLELAKCSVQGADGGTAPFCSGMAPGKPGITAISGAIVRVSGGSVTAGALSNPATAIATTSATALVDPSTVLVGSSTATLKFIPRTVGRGANPGGSIQCSLEGPTNLPGVVLFSVLVRPPFPFFEGNIWLDPNQLQILLLGSTGPGGVLTASIAVPAGIPRGISVTLQSGVVLAGASDWLASLPAIVLVL